MKDYFNDYKPTEDIFISIDDKIGTKRTSEEIDFMFNEIREIINNHGFDLSSWGNAKSIYNSLKLRFK